MRKQSKALLIAGTHSGCGKITVTLGLMAATFLTLVVVPVLYFLLERSKEQIAARWRWTERKRLELYSGYGLSGYQIPLPCQKFCIYKFNMLGT